MKTKRTVSRVLSACMLLSICNFPVSAAEEAAPPTYNAAADCYEISSPAQLMYLSGTWKDDAPRDGTYVLTADIDMTGYEDFLPIASKKDEGFIGTFDGRFHTISNLTINYPKKYVGLFGYVGNEDQVAYIKNTALENETVIGQQNVGGIAGVNYGTITGCVVTGKIRVDDLSNSHTGGGICGKVKEGEGPVIGKVENCYTNVTMEAPYDVGGIAGIQDGGGYVGHSIAFGTVDAYGDNGAAGGVCGSFNAGDQIVSCVSAQSAITGTKNTDKIVGQLADEAATNIVNNLAWEGTDLRGNEPELQPIQWQDVSAEALRTKQTYVSLDWDFDTVWEWVGDETDGSVKLQGFDEALFTEVPAAFDGMRVISRAVNQTKLGTDAVITADVIGSEAVQSVKLFWGDSADGSTMTQSTDMKQSGAQYTGSIPTEKAGTMYYYIEVKTDQGTYTKPFDKKDAIGLYVDDGRILGTPSQITMTPDTTQGNLRFSWITVPEVTDSVIRYKIKGEDKWQTVTGTSYIDAVTAGWKEKSTHQAVLENLKPDATYVYQVGDGEAFMSEEHSFTAPAAPDADAFSFIFVADPQSVSEEDYDSFAKSLDYALTVCPNPAFIMNGGDTTQDGYKSTEWEACFNVMGDYYATYPTVTTPGNHEMKGDWGFVSFSQRFNMPGGETGTEFDNTIGCIEYGDACIVVLNTEVTPPADKAAIIRKELEWAKACYENSDKKWRIMLTHAGPYTSNHDPLEVRDYFINDSAYSLDALQVDLFLNGHDHIYIRSEAKNDQRAAIGEGTTYVTGGTVGNKYYEYIPSRSDATTANYHDDEDRQTFSVFTVSADQIAAKAYQCDDDDTDAKADAEAWNDWSVADSYEIRNSLSEGKKAAHYIDLPSDAWFYGAAEFAISNNLFKGTEDYAFSPNEEMTRAMLVTVLDRVNSSDAAKYGVSSAGSKRFADVPAGLWYTDAVAWASGSGLVSGTSDTAFSPDSNITREQLAAILYRYADKLNMAKAPAADALAAFGDAGNVLPYAETAMGWAVEQGILNGRTSTSLEPQGTATRAEVAAMLQRFIALS